MASGPHLSIPVRAQGVDKGAEKQVDADLHIMVSFRALLILGVVLNLISVPMLNFMTRLFI